MNIEGETTFEQLPSNLRGETPQHRPWALIIILIVLIAFGAFWYYQHTHETVIPEAIQTIPITTTPIPQPQQTAIDDLQAAVNIAIPDYSKDF